MVHEGRHKFAYLTGEIPRSRLGDPQENIWKGEDFMLQSLLINSMRLQIRKLWLLEISRMQFRNYILKGRVRLVFKV